MRKGEFNSELSNSISILPFHWTRGNLAYLPFQGGGEEGEGGFMGRAIEVSIAMNRKEGGK
jgi:hypothetical protein